MLLSDRLLDDEACWLSGAFVDIEGVLVWWVAEPEEKNVEVNRLPSDVGGGGGGGALLFEWWFEWLLLLPVPLFPPLLLPSPREEFVPLIPVELEILFACLDSFENLKNNP